MTPADWAAVIPSVIVVGGTGIKLILSLSRLIGAVERLTESVETIAGNVQDHERRLLKLEARRAARKAPQR